MTYVWKCKRTLQSQRTLTSPPPPHPPNPVHNHNDKKNTQNRKNGDSTRPLNSVDTKNIKINALQMQNNIFNRIVLHLDRIEGFLKHGVPKPFVFTLIITNDLDDLGVPKNSGNLQKLPSRDNGVLPYPSALLTSALCSRSVSTNLAMGYPE